MDVSEDQTIITKGPLDNALFQHIREFYPTDVIIDRWNNEKTSWWGKVKEKQNGNKETSPTDNR